MYCCSREEINPYEGLSGTIKIWITGTEINKPLATNEPNYNATFKGKSTHSPYVDTNP